MMKVEPTVLQTFSRKQVCQKNTARIREGCAHTEHTGRVEAKDRSDEKRERSHVTPQMASSEASLEGNVRLLGAAAEDLMAEMPESQHHDPHQTPPRGTTLSSFRFAHFEEGSGSEAGGSTDDDGHDPHRTIAHPLASQTERDASTNGPNSRLLVAPATLDEDEVVLKEVDDGHVLWRRLASYMFDREPDITVFVGAEAEGCPTEVRVHGCLFAAASPFFNRMLNNGMKESLMKEIHLPAVSTDTFHHISTYIQTGQVTLSNANIVDVCIAAKQFGLDSLLAQCEDQLTRSLDDDNVWNLYTMALTHGYLALQRRCVAFIASGKATLLVHPSLAQVPADSTLLEVLHMKRPLTAYDKVVCLNTWVYGGDQVVAADHPVAASSSSSSSFKGEVERRIAVGRRLIRLVSLSQLTVGQLEEIVRPFTLVSEEEIEKLINDKKAAAQQHGGGLLPGRPPEIDTGDEDSFATAGLAGAHGPQFTAGHLQRSRFLLAPLSPLYGVMLTRIIRTRKGGRYTFQMFVECPDQTRVLVMSASRKSGPMTPYYAIYMDESPVFDRTATEYLGKLRGNMEGTEFRLFDSGSSPRKGLQTDTDFHRSELAAIVFEYSAFNRGPRRMQVALPRVSPHGTRSVVRPSAGAGGGILDLLRVRDFQNIFPAYNKPPRWNPQVNSFVLNFNGRVTQASMKNIQLVTSEDLSNVLLQFGKVAQNEFTCDFRFPLSPFQAFAIAISTCVAGECLG